MKKINFILVILFWLLSFFAFSQSNEEKIKAGFEYCDETLHKLATSIMNGRQSGVSKAMMQSMVKELGSDADALIGFAYEYPQVKQEARADTVRQFADTAKGACRNSVLQKHK